jgi:shikimate dehydrogenase
MKINGKTRLCGLIGNPVEHTLSPIIHNNLAELFGHNLVYVPFLVKDEIAEAIKGAYALNILGMNVTVPHKSNVIPFLKEIDPLAEAIGAVNTLVRVEGGYRGYNTDMTGLLRAMYADKIKIKEQEIIILGAGGAARAVAYLCVNEGAGKIYLLNRSLDKAQAVAEEVNSHFGKNTIVAMPIADYDKLPDRKFLAIQGTSVGLSPNDEDVVIADEAFYRKIHTGYDLIYKPFETKFMRLVRANGGKAYNGLKMLLYQGVIAYELWSEVEVSQEVAMQIYQKMKEAIGIYE